MQPCEQRRHRFELIERMETRAVNLAFLLRGIFLRG
jgi:hypothetical protein